MSNTVFEIYEQPQPVSPRRENPDVDNPDMENPHMENPHGENPAQLNTNQVITNERNNSLRNYQSINLDGMDNEVCKLCLKPLKFISDGAPCAVKAACTVRSGGKSGDNFKGLPIAIRRKCSCAIK